MVVVITSEYVDNYHFSAIILSLYKSFNSEVVQLLYEENVQMVFMRNIFGNKYIYNSDTEMSTC